MISSTSDLFKYGLVATAAFLVSLLATGFLIPYLRGKQFGQFIREEGPQAHLAKAGTPTMGGIAICAGVTLASLLAMLLKMSDSRDLLVVLLSMYAFGAIGFIDDYNKISKKQNEGLKPAQKLLLQCLFGAGIAVYMMMKEGSVVLIPFTRQSVNMGWAYIPFIIFIEVAMANSVNLTDGLDGLASGVSAVVAFTFSIVGMTAVNGGSEPMAVSGQAVLGAAIGFLMYNHYPAKIFMGDTGSMALGGVLSAMAIVGHVEWLLPIGGAVFVIEALSVIIQVIYFKKTGGKRFFRMAPIHHHFELGGWHETKVVNVFYIFTVICGIIAILSVI